MAWTVSTEREDPLYRLIGLASETDKRFFDRYDDYERIQQILIDQSVDMLIYTPDEISKINSKLNIQNLKL